MRPALFLLASLDIGWGTLASVSATSSHQQQQLQEALQW